VTSPLRRRIRHARRFLGYGSLVALIALALLVSIFNQMLPAVESHQDKSARWLSDRVGDPVSFSRARGEWTRRGPRFVLDDLRVGKGANVLAVGRAQLQVAAFTGWMPNHPLTELKVRQLSLTLQQHDDGRWEVIGLPGQGATGDPLERLEGFGELQIEKAQLRVHSPRLGFDMAIPRIDARLRVSGPRLLAGVSAWVDADDAPVSAVLDFDRKEHDGLLYAGGNGLVIAHWAPLLRLVGVRPEAGRGELALWTHVRDQRIEDVRLRADIAGVKLRSTAPMRAADGTLLSSHVGFDRLRADASWRKTPDGWRLDAPSLSLKQGDKVSRLDGLVVEGGPRFHLQGRELDLSPLAAMLALSDRLPDGLRLFLLQSNPQAVLRDVAISGRRAGGLRGSARIERLALQPYGQRPGLTGVAGRVRFDEYGGVMRLDSAAPVRLDWPVALHAPEELRLQGSVSVWRDGAGGWQLGTGGLNVRGKDFATQLRMAMGFQADRSKPTLDFAAHIDPASVAVAKRFWILHKMPPATVRWLDEALVAGEVTDGRVAIGGDLDDWPFAGKGGAFDARAHVRDGTVKFSKEWPQGEHMELDLDFFGPGFTLEGSGELLGNKVASVSGGIERFHEPWLRLDIAADSEGEALRQLLLHSPLEKQYGEHMRALTISGAAKVGVQLYLPLRQGLGDQHVDGSVELSEASLADSRWNIKFTGVNGRTSFNQRGFATDNLAVKLGDEAGTFNLRVGDATGDAGVAALATLDGQFSPGTLLDHAPDLAWMKPYAKGSAHWRVAVGVPKEVGGRTPPSHLRVASDLVGVEMTMPAPLAKAAATPLALEVQAPLPLEGEMNLRLGNLMRLRAQVHEKAPMAGSVVFGDGAFAALPAQGLVVRGHVPLLDSTGWVAFAAGDRGGSNGTPVRSVDVQADKLLFIDHQFADTHVQVEHSPALTNVVLKGKGIDGTVDVPQDTARGVKGNFATLYLPSDDSPPGTTAAVAEGGVAVEDPSALPPMRISIADLRIGASQLGHSELQTSPIANGMRIDKWSTRAKNLSLDAAGEWVKNDGGSRTSMRIEFTAASLGQMLDTLGYGDMVEGGKTHAELSGNWPGSPGEFALATLSGSLKAEVGEGRMLDVEPGGSGRILGLLSLAEIPRRLTLDFSDFFKKGFAFNTVKGDFAFADGVARTDNLRIDGPAAEIHVSGSTQMRDKLYDQRVEVLPKAGGVLPAIGFLVGGPAGAAVGAVAQGVFNKPLKQSTRVVYHVSGPWDKPVVKVVEKGPAKGAPSTSHNTAPQEATAMEKR
jgi:uncharacterized protein (TIGR02099 family)